MTSDARMSFRAGGRIHRNRLRAISVGSVVLVLLDAVVEAALPQFVDGWRTHGLGSSVPIILAAGAVLAFHLRKRIGLFWSRWLAVLGFLSIFIPLVTHERGLGVPVVLISIGLLSGGTLLLTFGFAIARSIAQLLALVVVLMAGTTLLAFLFRVTQIEGVQELTSTTPSAAAGLVLLALGVLFADPKHGVARALVNEDAAGEMVRWFIPTALGGTLVLGLVVSFAASAGLFSPQFALAVFVELEMILLAFLIWRSARQLQEIDDERLLAVEELRRSNDELELRVERRTEELRRLNQELESFSYSISHDLRTPLRAIDGFSRMFEEDYGDRVDDKGRRYLEVIRSNTRKMGQLISDLLAFSRVSRQEVAKMPLDLAALAREVFDSISIEGGHEQRFVLDDDLPLARADASLMRQVLQNLLTNAVKYSEPKPGGTIRFGGERDNGTNRYWVRDEGVGFDPAYKEKLFRVFQRLHHDDEFEGTGVGLSIVKRVIEKHGGDVSAESVPGAGSTFYFSLPASGSGEETEVSHERS